MGESGKKIGSHDGAFFLTIGQRHGFRVTEKTPNDSPYYIIDKNIKNNTITVSQDKTKIKENESKVVKLKDISWTLGETPYLSPSISLGASKTYSARIRYRQPLEECTIVKSEKLKGESDEYELHFTNSQKAITPGQSAVIYDGEVCLGGGVIND